MWRGTAAADPLPCPTASSVVTRVGREEDELAIDRVGVEPDLEEVVLLRPEGENDADRPEAGLVLAALTGVVMFNTSATGRLPHVGNGGEGASSVSRRDWELL